jgi:hypothetical protein
MYQIYISFWVMVQHISTIHWIAQAIFFFLWDVIYCNDFRVIGSDLLEYCVAVKPFIPDTKEPCVDPLHIPRTWTVFTVPYTLSILLPWENLCYEEICRKNYRHSRLSVYLVFREPGLVCSVQCSPFPVSGQGISQFVLFSHHLNWKCAVIAGSQRLAASAQFS